MSADMEVLTALVRVHQRILNVPEYRIGKRARRAAADAVATVAADYGLLDLDAVQMVRIHDAAADANRPREAA